MAEDPDTEKGWRKFQRLSFDKKRAIKRIRRAETVSVRHAHKFLLKRWRNVRDVRRVVIVWILAVGCLIAAVSLQLFWDQQSYQTTTGAPGGTYAEAAIGPVDTLNPLFAASPAEASLGKLLFSSILTYDTAGTLNYDLAKNVTRSDDGLVYTVVLRNDARWHDGRRLTADDVVFTTELIKDTATRTQIRGWDTVSVKKKGDYTVEFNLSAAYAPFMSALTFPVLPKHILGEVAHESLRENTFSNNPIGSGPFSFRLLQDGDASEKRRIVHLVANKQYYGGAPKLARVQIFAVADEAAMARALKLNEVNAASGLSRDQAGQFASKRYSIDTRPIQAGVYAFLNNESEILSDKTVRKALQLATNTPEIRKKIGGDAPELSLPYTNLQLKSDSIAPPVYNPEEAEKLLDEAGWKLHDGVRKKDNVELRLSVVTAKNAEYERALETLIGQWRQVGVQVDERIVDAADPTQNFVSSVLQQRTYDVLLYQISIGRDPDVFAYWHSSQAVARGLNLSNYSSPLSDDNLASARSSKSDALRTAKHLAFTKQWLADAPAIGLYQSTLTTVTTRNVQGQQTNTILVGPEQRYNGILYWTVGEQTVYKTP